MKVAPGRFQPQACSEGCAAQDPFSCCQRPTLYMCIFVYAYVCIYARFFCSWYLYRRLRSARPNLWLCTSDIVCLYMYTQYTPFQVQERRIYYCRLHTRITHTHTNTHTHTRTHAQYSKSCTCVHDPFSEPQISTHKRAHTHTSSHAQTQYSQSCITIHFLNHGSPKIRALDAGSTHSSKAMLYLFPPICHVCICVLRIRDIKCICICMARYWLDTLLENSL